MRLVFDNQIKLHEVGQQAFGYLVDLDTVALVDNGQTWIHAIPLGKYKHPRFGEIDITPERVARFAANVKNNVRGTELDIDYDHKEKTTEAAGWVKDAEARLGDPDPKKNGLWLAVEWTQDALVKLRNKAYRYFSPEYSDTWTHPKTQAEFKDVLFGGGLTNRPFLKDIMPINLSEINLSGDSMLEELRKLLQLPDDADEATVLSAAQDKLTPEPQDDTKPPVEPVVKVDDKKEPEKVSVTANENTTLAESDPVVKAMGDRIATLEAALRLSEVNSRLNELNTNGKYAVTPVAAQKLRDLALETPTALTDKYFELIKELTEGNGMVELGELGRTTGDAGTSATKRFDDKVESLVKNDKLDYATAADRVAMSDPELFSAYRSESYVREGK